MIAAQKETVGLNTGGGNTGGGNTSGGSLVAPPQAPPTLAEAGIDKKLSSRAQKLAAVPEEKFENLRACDVRHRVADTRVLECNHLKRVDANFRGTIP